MTNERVPHAPIDGPRMRDLWVVASENLTANAAAIDAINVYPVPDGDTGSNMSGTLREAVENASLVDEPVTIERVLAALAKGALYGARGNSGVILSQALRGFGEGVGNQDLLDGASLARGMAAAAAAAYRAVSKPVEGTMLTVLRAAGEAAVSAANAEPGGHCTPVIVAALRAAEAAEAATQEQLPALNEAGVPDSGGEGMCVILEGLYGAITGRMPERLALPSRPVAMMPGHAVDEFGSCTEFIIEAGGAPLDEDEVREVAASGGNSSVVVVGDPSAYRVHAHSRTPELLLAEAAKLGSLSRVKVEDMTAQHGRFQATGSGAGAKTALLAISPGPGIDALFRSYGASILDMGDVVKPAAGDIAAAADALLIADVVVLPNHKNIVWAAQQAAGLSRCTLHVVPSKSVPEGIAAALAFRPAALARENVAAMEPALSQLTTVEVTFAAAARTADGVTVKEGDPIALVDDRLIGTGSDALDALMRGLREAGAAEGGLVTVYRGDAAAEREAIGAAIGEAFAEAEVEIVEGGQAMYPYIASVEA